MDTLKSRLISGFKMILLPLAMYLFFLILSSIVGVGSFGMGLSMRTALRSAVYTCLIAWGMSFNLLANRWDYSVGAVLVLSSILGPRFAMALDAGPAATLILCSLIGVFFSGIVGLTFILTRIPPLVVSMGFLLLWEGLSSLVYEGGGVNVTGSPLMSIARFPNFLIPFAVFFLIAYIVFSKTQLGYDIRAISYGANVAFNVGVKEKRAIFVAYALGGLFMGAGGYFSAAQIGQVWPAMNAGSVVTAFSCCIPVFIGKFLSRYGNMMVGVVMGSLALAFMNSGLSSLGISSSLQTTFNGFFLLAFLVVTANEERFGKYLESKKIARLANEKAAAARQS